MRTAILCLISLFLLAGCAAESRSTVTGPHAECPVCKANADLACVDIPVDASTPSCECDGQRYYFCSDECRKEFEKNPAKYVHDSRRSPHAL